MIQVQVLLRLYTSLLPHLRQVALQQRPGWALGTAEEASCGFEGDLELEATIKQESAAVLNIGHAFHSEGRRWHWLCFVTHSLHCVVHLATHWEYICTWYTVKAWSLVPMYANHTGDVSRHRHLL